MPEPICRCGREKWQHNRLPINNFMPLCLTYAPMNFRPFMEQIDTCCCDLCNSLNYAASSGAAGRRARVAPLSEALFDALESGTHVRREPEEWNEKQRANSSGGRGGQSSGGVQFDGTGVGVTPGGIPGSRYRRQRTGGA